MRDRLYRISDTQTWAQSERGELLALSPLDRRDGFVHLSTATQVRDTLRRFFAGHEDVVLLTIQSSRLIDGSLRFEAPSTPDAEFVHHAPSELFPHYYGQVPRDAIIAAQPLKLDERGAHRLPSTLVRAINDERDDHSSVELRVAWDIDKELALIEYSRPARIADEAGMYAWEATLERQLGDFVERRGGKIAAVIGLDNLHVATKLERRYAELADKVCSRWFSTLARWTVHDPSREFFARANRERALPNAIFSSREQAVRFVLESRHRPTPCPILPS